MWIKTKNGDYYNVDHCNKIILDDYGCTRFHFDGYYIPTQGDYRDIVVKNIVSGTKILEV